MTYDRTSSGMIRSLPLGSLVDLQIGGEFDTRYWQALKTSAGWVRVVTKLTNGQYILGSKHEKLLDAVLEKALDERRLWVKVKGPKVGQKIEHPVSLDGLSSGAQVVETEQYAQRLGNNAPRTYTRKGDSWVTEDSKELPSWAFDAVIRVAGLVLEKL
jgi:hypothetical protein